MKQYLDFKNIPDWEPLSVCIYQIYESLFLNVKNLKNEELYCQLFGNDAMPLTVLISYSWALPPRAVSFLQI